MEVADEHINFPLVSYLLAKVQQLEAKMMVKRTLEKLRNVLLILIVLIISKLKIVHSKWLLISDGGTLLVHMGLILFTKELLWEVVMTKGSPSNMMCLPPTYIHYSNNQTGQIPVDAVEYRVSGPIYHANYRNMPCALCEATGRGDNDPFTWHKEYNGYIMAGTHGSGNEGGSMYECIDEHLEQVTGTGGSESAHLLYTVYATGSRVPSDSGYALSCVVCTK